MDTETEYIVWQSSLAFKCLFVFNIEGGSAIDSRIGHGYRLKNEILFVSFNNTI